MSEPLSFETRAEFRLWLSQNALTSEGVWLLLKKNTDVETLKASEALEEALCFGWIDSTIKHVDEKLYLKYFSERRKVSKWSLKNKSLVEDLENRGLMTDFGRAKIAEAQKNGQWDKSDKDETITDEHIEKLAELVKGNELAYTNFIEMSPSVKKTYAKAYFDAKTEAGRLKRLAWLSARLEKNQKPM